VPKPGSQAVKPLVVYIIYDGESYQLEEFFHARIQELDRASGEQLHFFEIGHPGQSGPVFRCLAEKQLGRRWKQAESAYVKNILLPGLEHDRRREDMQKLAEKFAIPAKEIPALVIPVRAEGRRAVWLTIPREWHSTEDGQRAFGRALREWCASPLVRGAVERDVISQGSAESLFDALKDQTIELLSQEDAARSRASLMRGSGWAPSFASARLAIRTSTQQVFYHDCEVCLTPTDFRLLRHLAEHPGTMIPHEELHQRAGEYPGATGTDPSLWAKNHKRSVVRAFKKLTGQRGVAADQLQRLIESRHKCMRLNIPKSEVFIEA
jgi:hypothetical protein